MNKVCLNVNFPVFVAQIVLKSHFKKNFTLKTFKLLDMFYLIKLTFDAI